ncbi:uncharacterized protein DS421_14g458070 [Arachis hypogaea]|nr:uncharacterized protein DS421_14g458070 [Arachis hypogaea]
MELEKGDWAEREGLHCDHRPAVAPPWGPPSGPSRRKGEAALSASRREGLAASSVVLTAAPPSGPQSWRKHSATMGPFLSNSKEEEGRYWATLGEKETRAGGAASSRRRRAIDRRLDVGAGLAPPLLLAVSSCSAVSATGKSLPVRVLAFGLHSFLFLGFIAMTLLCSRGCRSLSSPLPLEVVDGVAARLIWSCGCFVSLAHYCGRDWELRFWLPSVWVEAERTL